MMHSCSLGVTSLIFITKKSASDCSMTSILSFGENLYNAQASMPHSLTELLVKTSAPNVIIPWTLFIFKVEKVHDRFDIFITIFCMSLYDVVYEVNLYEMLNVTISLRSQDELNVVHQANTRFRHLTPGSDMQKAESKTRKTKTAATPRFLEVWLPLKTSYETWTLNTCRHHHKTPVSVG